VIVPDIVTHFFSSIISGIESVANAKGYYIVISSSNESYKKEVESVENLIKSRVEGLIVCISQETSDFYHFERLSNMRIPLVFFDRICESLPIPSVTVDGLAAASKVVRHFFDKGRRRIAYISGPSHLNISKNRKSGYLQGLKECGLPFVPDYLVDCNLSAEAAAVAMQKLINLPERPDAVFGINDTVAFSAMKEIRRVGLKIPDDMALVGFTDEFHATVVDPPLTSVTHPTFRMGEEAARLFFDCIDSKNTVSEKVVLNAELVIRDSS
jgi:LacI family transcriptional regulator